MGGRLQWRVNAVEEFCSGERGFYGLERTLFLQWSDFAVEGFYGFEMTLFLQWSDFAVERFYGVEMTLFFAVEGFL